MGDSKEVCDVCCEHFNKVKNAKVECNTCDSKICRSCTRKYLLSSTDDPHCMSCKTRWSKDFLVKATLKSFVDNDWKSHHGNVLLEREMARLPETMPAVENTKKMYKCIGERDELSEEISKVQKHLNELENKRRDINNEIIGRANNTYNKEKENKATFIKKCPNDKCKGFLSSNYKCKLCDTEVCSKCFAIKNDAKEDGEESKHAGHVCNPDDVASAQLIKKSCKNCPKCATEIHKIEGCDQMWCTQCHTAFSWKTGKIVNGVIHNPHFYAWQKEGGGGATIHPPGAVMCGGVPRLYDFRIGLQRMLKVTHWMQNTFANELNATNDWMKNTEAGAYYAIALELHRASTHISFHELGPLRTRCNENRDNEDIRVKFMMNQLDKKEMKSEILKRDTKKQKARACLDIYELINTVLTESVRDIYESIVLNKTLHSLERPESIAIPIIKRNLERCMQIKEYANKELKKISVLYNQSVTFIRTGTEKVTPTNSDESINVAVFYFPSKKFTRAELDKSVSI